MHKGATISYLRTLPSYRQNWQDCANSACYSDWWIRTLYARLCQNYVECMPELYQNYANIMPELSQTCTSKMAELCQHRMPGASQSCVSFDILPELRQNYTTILSAWCQNYIRLMPGLCQNCAKSSPKLTLRAAWPHLQAAWRLMRFQRSCEDRPMYYKAPYNETKWKASCVYLIARFFQASWAELLVFFRRCS